MASILPWEDGMDHQDLKAAVLLSMLPPPPSTDTAHTPDTTVLIPCYREVGEAILGVGSYLFYKDPDLKQSIQLMIILDGHPPEPSPDNDTLHVLRLLLDIPSDRAGTNFPGHFRVWRGHINGISYALYVKDPALTRGKRMSQIIAFDLLLQRDMVLDKTKTSKTSMIVINQDCDTRVPEAEFHKTRNFMLKHGDYFASCPIMETVNRDFLSPLTVFGDAQEMQRVIFRHSLGIFHKVDVVSGPFSAFNLDKVRMCLDDFAMPNHPSSLIELQLHLGEDAWLGLMAMSKGFKAQQMQTEAHWVLPGNLTDFLQQHRRWLNSNMAMATMATFRTPDLWHFKHGLCFYAIYFTLTATFVHWTTPGILIGALWALLKDAQVSNPTKWMTLGPSLPDADMLFFSFMGFLCLLALYFSGRNAEQAQYAVALGWFVATLGQITIFFMLWYLIGNEILLIIGAGALLLAILPILLLSHPKRWLKNISSAIYLALLGLGYYIIVPLYSVCNADNCSWGIRENKEDKDSYSLHPEARSKRSEALSQHLKEEEAEFVLSSNLPVEGSSPDMNDENAGGNPEKKIALELERTICGLHSVVYDRNHLNLTPKELDEALKLLALKKWGVATLWLALNIGIACGSRYVCFPGEGIWISTHIIHITRPVLLILVCFTIMRTIAALVGFIQSVRVGPARSPFGKPTYNTKLCWQNTLPKLRCHNETPEAGEPLNYVRDAKLHQRYMTALSSTNPGAMAEYDD